MGIFSRIKNGISSKANAALDKAIDPEKELDMAILQLEEQRKKALMELVSYKATAKQLEQDIAKYQARVVEWERRAMVAVKAGDDDSAKLALKEKKAAQIEVAKITHDRDEAASYAITLNKSRKEFEVKLSMLKMRKGTLAMQIASARSPGGDAFGNDQAVWDKFKRAEDRIDSEAIESEVDAAMRGEEVQADFDRKLLAATGGNPALLAADTEDQLAGMKAKVEAARAAKQKALAPPPAAPAPPASAESPAASEPPPPVPNDETEALLAKLKAEVAAEAGGDAKPGPAPAPDKKPS